MSRRELAEAANAYVWKHTNGQQRTALSERDIGRYERYEAHWPDEWRRFGLRGVLGASSDAELGFYPTRKTNTNTSPAAVVAAQPKPDGSSGTAAAGSRDRTVAATAPYARDGATLGEVGRAVAGEASCAGSEGSPIDGSFAGTHRDFASDPDRHDLLDRAGDESLLSASRIWSQSLPGAAIDQLWVQVRTLSRAYATTTAVDSLLGARRVRDLGLQLLEVTRRPQQVEQLYLSIGHACALMGLASFDLRSFQASLQHAAAAYTFADMVGHSGLRSWARGLQAQTAFWRGRPDEAVELASHAVAIAPAGTGKARILCILARAFSHLGDAARTRRALTDARRVRDSLGQAGTDELHDEIGGPFGWGPARQAACTSNALLRIGDAHAAADQARLAITLHDADDTGTLVDTRASADIAAAELASDELDAAQDALHPVWQVPPHLRRYGLLGRLEDIANTLTQPRYRHSPTSTAVREQISAYTDQAPRGLPVGTG